MNDNINLSAFIVACYQQSDSNWVFEKHFKFTIDKTYFFYYVDYAESDDEVRFGDLEGCNDPFFVFASYHDTFLMLNKIIFEKIPYLQALIAYLL